MTTSLDQVPEELQRKVHLQRSNYLVSDNKLYKNSSYGPLLIPTLKQRPNVITELHEGHGHFGQEATYRRARTQFYWPNMYENLKEAIKVCHVCQVAEKRKPKQISLWPIHTSHLFQRFGLDYVGPLTETAQGYKFLLVITEYYTRWPMAFAVRSADALTTAKIVYSQVFCTFGPPQEILTDRGSHFANAIIASLCQIVKVKHKFSTPYHPQTNGLVENFNGTLVQILRKLSVDFPTQWDDWVDTALYCYRTKVHNTLNFSPYELLFGVMPRSSDPIQFAGQALGQERLMALDDKRTRAHERLGKKQEQDWNPVLTFKKGDIVLVRRVRKLKIQTPWEDTLYIIYRVHDNNTYDLIDAKGDFYKSRLNAIRLKKYHLKVEPSSSS